MLFSLDVSIFEYLLDRFAWINKNNSNLWSTLIICLPLLSNPYHTICVGSDSYICCKYQDLILSVISLLIFQERVGLIDKQYTADKEKLHKIRLLLVRIIINSLLLFILKNAGEQVSMTRNALNHILQTNP